MPSDPNSRSYADRLCQLQQDLRGVGYIADEALASALCLMDALGRPLLLEGDAGVGKTAVAAALAQARGAAFIRLQCYEGLDLHSALYEWNVQRQFLEIKRRQETGSGTVEEEDLFAEKFLLKRPLLEAITQERAPVLLIDEIDRADEEFEAFLLELLSDFQVSIPELGVITARARPLVVLTANGTRELSDALRRRCLYLLLDYPSPEKEREILQASLPGIDDHLCEQVVRAVQRLRGLDLRKSPGVAETLDWAAALLNMQVTDLTTETPWLIDSLSCLLKTQEDQERVSGMAPSEWVS